MWCVCVWVSYTFKWAIFLLKRACISSWEPHMRKSTIHTEKRPIHAQKSPEQTQKRPIHTQKSSAHSLNVWCARVCAGMCTPIAPYYLRALWIMWRALLSMYRAVLSIYWALLSIFVRVCAHVCTMTAHASDGRYKRCWLYVCAYSARMCLHVSVCGQWVSVCVCFCVCICVCVCRVCLKDVARVRLVCARARVRLAVHGARVFCSTRAIYALYTNKKV